MTKTINARLENMIANITTEELTAYFAQENVPDYLDMVLEHGIDAALPSWEKEELLAWFEKLESLETQRFTLQMKDGWTQEDYETDRKLAAEINAMRPATEEKPQQTTTAAPAMIENPHLTAEEKKDITDRMFRMMTTDIYNGTFDMDAYKALEAKLYVPADTARRAS